MDYEKRPALCASQALSGWVSRMVLFSCAFGVRQDSQVMGELPPASVPTWLCATLLTGSGVSSFSCQREKQEAPLVSRVLKAGCSPHPHAQREGRWGLQAEQGHRSGPACILLPGLPVHSAGSCRPGWGCPLARASNMEALHAPAHSQIPGWPRILTGKHITPENNRSQTPRCQYIASGVLFHSISPFCTKKRRHRWLRKILQKSCQRS